MHRAPRPQASALRIAVVLVSLAWLLGACGQVAPPDPYAGIAALQIAPGAVLLTDAGQEASVSVRAYDAEGREIDLTDLPLAWAVSDEAAVRLESVAGSPTQTQIRALADLGSALVTARFVERPDLAAQPVPVTIATPKPGAVLVPDPNVVYPPTDLPPGASPATFDLPHVTIDAAGAFVGSFTEQELAERFGVTAEGDPLVGVVLVDATVAVGDLVIASGGAGFAGRVTAMDTRDGYVLAQLQTLTLPELYDDLRFTYTEQELDAIGVDGSQPAPGAASILRAQASCQLKGGITAGTFQLPGLLFSFTPIGPHATVELATDTYALSFELVAEAKLEPSFDIQPGLNGAIECTLQERTPLTLPLPGPLAALASFRASPADKFEGKVEFTSGPRISGKGTLGMKVGLKVAFDSTASPMNQSDVGFEPLYGFEGSAEGLSGLEDLAFTLTLRLFEEAKLEVQLGGSGVAAAERVTAWLPFLGELVKSAARALRLDVLQGEIGPVATAKWESRKRVLVNEVSATTIGADAKATLLLKSDSLNELLGTFGFAEVVNFKLAEISVPIGRLFRVFDDQTILAQSSCFDGEVEDAPICVQQGDTVRFDVTVEYTDPPLLAIASDMPLNAGEAYLDKQTKLADAVSVDPATRTMVFSIPITADVCGADPVISFLALNDMLGLIEAPGWAGKAALFCNPPATTHTITVDVQDPTVIVTSDPTGIQCGGGATACSRDFPAGTLVDLQGECTDGACTLVFSGCDSVDAGVCTIDVTTDVTIVVDREGTSDTFRIGHWELDLTAVEGVFPLGGASVSTTSRIEPSAFSDFGGLGGSYPAVFAGAGGYAVVDLADGEVLLSETVTDVGPLFGVIGLQRPDGSAPTLFGVGAGGWVLHRLHGSFQDPIENPVGPVFDAYPAAGSSTALAATFAVPGDGIGFLGFDGSTYVTTDEELDASGFAGELVSSYLRDDGSAPAAPVLVLDRAVVSGLYLDLRDGSPPTRALDVGLDARRLRCAMPNSDSDLVCGVSVFGNDGIATVVWDGSTLPTAGTFAPAGDGPVGLDLAPLGNGNLALVTVGFEDDSLTEIEVAPDGSIVSSETVAAPTGCVEPGHAVYAADSAGLKIVGTCYGSGSYFIEPSRF